MFGPLAGTEEAVVEVAEDIEVVVVAAVEEVAADAEEAAEVDANHSTLTHFSC